MLSSDDPSATTYTEEELAALPQTDMVFDRPGLIVNDHQWIQRGYMIEDICKPARPDCHHVGIPIPSGKLLVKTEGGYDLVDDRRS